MTTGALVALIVALVVAGFVIWPLTRPDAAQAERLVARTSERRELESRKEMTLAALHDLEEDRATGKLDDDDYAELKSRLSARAVELMKRLDELEGGTAAS